VRAAAIFGVLTVAFLICVGFGIGGEWFSNAVDDIGELAAALIAAGACAIAGRRVAGARAGWKLMAWSSLSWAGGQAIWTYYDLVRGIEVPSPSAADLGFLAAVPLAVVGLHRLAPPPVRRAPHVWGAFDGMVIGCGALVAAWAVMLVRQPDGDELLRRLVGLAYPLGDLVMASVVLASVGRGTGNRTALRLVLAGVLAFTIADTWFAMVLTVGDFGLPYWLDTGWVLGYFLVALGAIWAINDRSCASSKTVGAVSRTTAGPDPLARGRAGVRSTQQVRYTHGWLATANAAHIVNYSVITLIVADASVVLYDLGAILKLLA
jgi:hypothetical protein